MLRVTFYTQDSLLNDDAATAVEVDYVSFVDAGTHGPPALVAPGRERGESTRPVVRPDETVLYINNGAHDAFPAFEIERMS